MCYDNGRGLGTWHGSDALPDVRPGQVWADCDPRCEGRTLRVDHIVGDEDGQPRAICTVLTNPHGRATARQVRIRVSRMKPTSTGYRLVQDAREVTA